LDLVAMLLFIVAFITAVVVVNYSSTYYKASRGERGLVKDMFYERRRAEACVDYSAHHALVNAGEREIV
jgi:hypothetical protein